MNTNYYLLQEMSKTLDRCLEFPDYRLSIIASNNSRAGYLIQLIRDYYYRYINYGDMIKKITYAKNKRIIEFENHSKLIIFSNPYKTKKINANMVFLDSKLSRKYTKKILEINFMPYNSKSNGGLIACFKPVYIHF